MPFQIAEGRREALATVQGMLVDAEDLRTLQAQSLLRFPLGKLSVDATDGRLPHVLPSGQTRGADPIVVPAEHLLSPSFRAVPPRHDSGQRLNEAPLAPEAPPSPTLHVQPTDPPTTIQVPHPTLVAALAAEAIASAARAGSRRLFGLKVEPHFYEVALHPDRAVSRKR